MDYSSLSSEERRKESIASKALYKLHHHLQDSSSALDTTFRRSLIHTITSDLTTHLTGGTDWSTQTTLSALASLKLLGRSSVATEDLTSHFPLFISYANLIPPNSVQLDKPNSSSLQSTLSNPSINQESLRILANALFLHPLSRSSPDLLPALVPLVELAIILPNQSLQHESDLPLQTHEDQHTYSFLASRVIFLITAVPSNLVIELIQKTSYVRNLMKAFQQELDKKSNPQAHSYQHIFQDILIENLKIIFNVMVHLPQSISQVDHTPPDALNQTSISISSPTCSNPENESSNYSSLAAAVSPVSPKRSLKQRFNDQIHFKKFRFRNHSDNSDTQDNQQDSFNDTTPDTNDSGSSKKYFFTPRNSDSKGGSKSSNLTDEPQEIFGPVTSPANNVFSGLLPYLVQLFLLEPIPEPPNLKPPFTSYMQTFLNFLPSAHCFFENYSHLPSTSFPNFNPKIPPLINKLILIIDKVTDYYCPNDPDDRLVKQKCEADGIDLNVDLTQIVLLTANLISNHTPFNSPSSSPVGLTKENREALIEMIIPSKIDRTIGLNKQSNLIGRILRLMNSVGFETLKQTCGGFLQALYADDTDHLASQVGYGPLAGYFLSIGKPALNPESNKYLSNSDLNPITGTYWSSSEEEEINAELNQSSTLTDEEKEREAERLCDLFDRMNKGGIMSVQDPRGIALQSGRFEEIENSIQADQQLKDQLEEEKILKDFQKYKESKK